MPARSNDFQAVVYFVKTQLAADATVVESASLHDRVTGQMRELDVLITGHMAGHLLSIGVECRDRIRKVEVGWVEEMHSKHADLPPTGCGQSLNQALPTPRLSTPTRQTIARARHITERSRSPYARVTRRR
ncbi:hypothetical protein [Actinomadura sp. 7K534]|uniref:hypothetical protein n=1 Tax=Actinomadura sp. 7K534 TaxID=2530366 RepID=UPI0010477148|nr:hypothetical protein [Actinomadura sp. 7K534]TDB89802.1 hypothetical protein E1266_29130 [Actinomadura sp. 7K534]